MDPEELKEKQRKIFLIQEAVDLVALAAIKALDKRLNIAYVSDVGGTQIYRLPYSSILINLNRGIFKVIKIQEVIPDGKAIVCLDTEHTRNIYIMV